MTDETHSPSAAPVTPALDASSAVKTFAEVLADRRDGLDACYATAQAANPRLGRTSIAFTFTLDELGKPTSVDLQYRNRMDETAKECLRDAGLGLVFPSSMQGRQTATLVFAPKP